MAATVASPLERRLGEIAGINQITSTSSLGTTSIQLQFDIGRNIGWRALIRADYRRDKRQSNVPGYDVTTSGFAIQLGFGLFGPGPSR